MGLHLQPQVASRKRATRKKRYHVTGTQRGAVIQMSERRMRP